MRTYSRLRVRNDLPPCLRRACLRIARPGNRVISSNRDGDSDREEHSQSESPTTTDRRQRLTAVSVIRRSRGVHNEMIVRHEFERSRGSSSTTTIVARWSFASQSCVPAEEENARGNTGRQGKGGEGKRNNISRVP